MKGLLTAHTVWISSQILQFSKFWVVAKVPTQLLDIVRALIVGLYILKGKQTNLFYSLKENLVQQNSGFGKSFFKLHRLASSTGNLGPSWGQAHTKGVSDSNSE